MHTPVLFKPRWSKWWRVGGNIFFSLFSQMQALSITALWERWAYFFGFFMALKWLSFLRNWFHCSWNSRLWAGTPNLKVVLSNHSISSLEWVWGKGEWDFQAIAVIVGTGFREVVWKYEVLLPPEWQMWSVWDQGTKAFTKCVFLNPVLCWEWPGYRTYSWSLEKEERTWKGLRWRVRRSK